MALKLRWRCNYNNYGSPGLGLGVVIKVGSLMMCMGSTFWGPTFMSMHDFILTRFCHSLGQTQYSLLVVEDQTHTINGQQYVLLHGAATSTARLNHLLLWP